MATDQIKYNDDLELYIHLHPAFFAYIIFESKSSTFIDFDVERHDGRQFINNKQLADWLTKNIPAFKYPFTKKIVCINARSFSLVNNEKLATPKNFKILNKFSSSKELLIIDKIREDLLVQFSTKKTAYSNLLDYFEEQEICFGDKGIIKALIKNDHNNIVFCQILGNEVTIAVKKDGQLALFNKYTFKNNEDLLYYILLCYQSNDLDTNEIPLYLSGLIKNDSPMYTLIFDYIKNVEITELSKSIKLNDSIVEKINHYYFNLLNIR